MKALLIAICKAVFTKGVSLAWENKGQLLLYWKTIIGKYRNLKIRFSISYIYRIKIPDTNNYLLVYNRRINNQLQPVGGAYKRYGDDKLFESWEHEADNKRNGLDTDALSSNDLRFRVRGRNVIKVIKWFEEGREREVGAEREFMEELIVPGILDRDVFQKIKYKHLKRVSKHLKWSEHHSCYEVLIYDILEFLPDEEQKRYLTELAKVCRTENYAIVSGDDIEQLRLLENGAQVARIGEHTKYIINQ